MNNKKKYIVIRKKRGLLLLGKIVFFVFTVFLLVLNDNLTLSKLAAKFLVLISAINVIKARKNWPLFIIYFFIAYANYSIALADYLFPVDGFLTSLKSNESAIVGINILLLFNSILFVGNPCRRINKSNVSSTYITKNNTIIVISITLLLAFIFVFCFERPSVAGERGSPSAIYEYSTLLFIVGFFYSYRKRDKIILTIMLALYMLQNLMYGGRVTAIQLFIIWFLYFAKEKITVAKAVPCLILGTILLTAIGNQRAQLSLSWDSFTRTVNNMMNSRLINDTSYSAYFSSQTFILTAQFHSWSQRLLLFLRFVMSIFLGGSLVEDSILATYTRQYYMHYGGGVLPIFGYFYLGIFGVILLGVYVSFVFRKTFRGCLKKSSGIFQCISIYFICTCPRWYLYSPLPLFRGFLLLSVVYGACYAFDYIVRHQFA